MEDLAVVAPSKKAPVVYYNTELECLNYQLHDALYVADQVGPHLSLLWEPNGHELIGCQILRLPVLLRISEDVSRYLSDRQTLFFRTLVGYARNARGMAPRSYWKYAAAKEFVGRVEVPFEQWSKAFGP